MMRDRYQSVLVLDIELGTSSRPYFARSGNSKKPIYRRQVNERRFGHLVERDELVRLVAVRAPPPPGHQDLDAGAREVARVARPDDVQPLGRLARLGADRFAECLDAGAALG